ncbi:MAG: hypothetical protein AAGF49_04405 [Pseudomonadota bacterium]
MRAATAHDAAAIHQPILVSAPISFETVVPLVDEIAQRLKTASHDARDKLNLPDDC